MAEEDVDLWQSIEKEDAWPVSKILLLCSAPLWILVLLVLSITVTYSMPGPWDAVDSQLRNSIESHLLEIPLIVAESRSAIPFATQESLPFIEWVTALISLIYFIVYWWSIVRQSIVSNLNSTLSEVRMLAPASKERKQLRCLNHFQLLNTRKALCTSTETLSEL